MNLRNSAREKALDLVMNHVIDRLGPYTREFIEDIRKDGIIIYELLKDSGPEKRIEILEQLRGLAKETREELCKKALIERNRKIRY